MSNLKKSQGNLTNEWTTPPWLFKKLDAEFHFRVDLACTENNRQCSVGLTDSLNKDWHQYEGWLWLNPPYSPLRPWIEKAQKESLLGAKIVMLIPPQAATKYFTKIMPSEIRYIIGRVDFLDENGVPARANTRESSIVIYGPIKAPVVSYIKKEDLL